MATALYATIAVAEKGNPYENFVNEAPTNYGLYAFSYRGGEWIGNNFTITDGPKLPSAANVLGFAGIAFKVYHATEGIIHKWEARHERGWQ